MEAEGSLDVPNIVIDVAESDDDKGIPKETEKVVPVGKEELTNEKIEKDRIEDNLEPFNPEDGKYEPIMEDIQQNGIEDNSDIPKLKVDSAADNVPLQGENTSADNSEQNQPAVSSIEDSNQGSLINENHLLTVSNKIPQSETFDLSLDNTKEEFYMALDKNTGGSGLWFKGHTPLPSESEDENEVKDQCEKILSYEHEFALPINTQPEATGNRHYVKNDRNFNEKDFSRHRTSSKTSHGVASQIIETKKRRKHKSKKGRNKEEFIQGKENEGLQNEFDDIDSPSDRPRSQTTNRLLSKKLSKIAEDKESSDNEGMRPRAATMSELEMPKRKGSHKNRNHRSHKHHHHARHLRSRGVNAQDDLEMRIRTGMQKLEEERKAYQGVLAEMDEGIGAKDLEDIASHRFVHYPTLNRYNSLQKKHYVKSGMTTHMSSDVDSVHSFKPHMKIEMEEDQLQLAPREFGRHFSSGDEQGFVELEELTRNENNEFQWKERARWIKFEEDVEKNERWGKPHVASLSFQSLLELRRGIETGSVLLGLDNFDLPTIFESVVDNLIITDQLSSNLKDRVIGVLLSKHCHHHQQARQGSVRRKFSFTSSPSLNKVEMNGTVVKDNETKETKETNVAVDGEQPLLNDRKASLETIQSKEAEMVTIELDDQNEDAVNDKKKKPGVKFAPHTEEPRSTKAPLSKTVSDVKQKIPIGAEATSVLVGTLEELRRPAMAFVRLSEGCFLGNLTEVAIPIRFLFVILGPPSNHDYYEIGRSIATLMSDKVFHDLAYQAKSRDDLLAAINSFLDDSIVLAPGDWDRHLLLPLLQAEITEKRRQRIKLLKEKAHVDHSMGDDHPFMRTGTCFGGLVRDVSKKAKHYLSDFKDGFNWRCLVTIIFVFFATLAPTITFGALLEKKTGGNLGTIETLLATSICGIIFSLTAGQPLMIVGTTGPILVFEQATYDLCEFFKIDFLLWRLWVGLFVMVILFCVVGFELCYLVEHFTRFTEEVFSVLISLLFVYECLYFLWKTLAKHPLKKVHELLTPPPTSINRTTAFLNQTETLPEVYTTASCTSQPNIGLVSLLLVLGTFFIAYWLRNLRRSHFFSSKARRVLSDIGVPIAMVLMVAVNTFLLDIDGLPMIKMPDTFRPTLQSRDGFYVRMENISIVYIIFAIPVAFCVSILLFMETELTGVLLNKRKNKLKKGGGYNLDLIVMGILTGISSVLGLPWMCAATVRSVQHQNALAIMSRSHAPGERPYLLHMKEQRITNLCIHILMGFCLLGSSLIRMIPDAVSFGVFLYLGLVSLAGIQFIEQIKLTFVPLKYHPNRKYVRNVRFRSLVTYTGIQFICLMLLIGAKLSPAAPAFPFVIICMVFLRRFIERYYPEEELEDLDNEDSDEEFEDDEYGIGLPM